ncbi:MAG: sugar 3,4-ketoisomerase [Bacilli bacterium]
MDVIKIDFMSHGDDRGQLVAIEEHKDIPFAIKRVYYIYDTLKDVVRGYHAHKCLKQVLICVHGSCKIKLDDGYSQEIVVLDKPYEGLYLESSIWREMFDFSSDAVLLVLASEPYDENDYIRNYDDFIKYVKESKNINID